MDYAKGWDYLKGRLKVNVKKIQEDIVLSKGGTKFHPLGNSNAGKDVLCLNLDFINLKKRVVKLQNTRINERQERPWQKKEKTDGGGIFGLENIMTSGTNVMYSKK